MRLAKCQISNEKNLIFPKTNLDRLQKLLATYNFADSLFCTRSPFKIILHPASWWLNNKHSLEQRLLHLSFATSTLAPVRWARL